MISYANHRRPHGRYVRETMDWFGDRRMGGYSTSNGSPSFLSAVSLYNNSPTGNFLHVYSMTGHCASGYVQCFLFNGTYGNLRSNSTWPITPTQQMLDGAIYGSSQAASPVNSPFWEMGFTNQQGTWPYDYLVCVLPPGWSLIGQGNANNQQVSMAFGWLVMGSNEGLY